MKKKLKKKAVKETSKSTVKEYSFFADVFEVARQITRGNVTSYGAIAAHLGTRLSARMGGWAMNTPQTNKPAPAKALP